MRGHTVNGVAPHPPCGSLMMEGNPVRPAVRWLAVPVVLGLALVAGSGVLAQQPSGPPAPRVVMFDNNGTFAPGDPATGQWTFVPAHITVSRGETITFDNPAGNFRPHTVTSITWEGQAPTRTLASGARFDSSPTRETLIMPGGSFTLDTGEWSCPGLVDT